MKHTILWKGKLTRRTVFKERTFRNPFEYPIDGDVGYAVVDYEEKELVFSKKYHVWHVPRIDLSRHVDALSMKRVETTEAD